MARTNAAVTVANTATPIKAANPNRAEILIVNNGSQTVYLGDASVTTANGIPLVAGASLEDRVSPVYDTNISGAWYGIVVSGTCDVRVLEG